MEFKIDENNIKNWLEAINTFNDTPENGTTRILFTKPELAARAYVKEEMKKIGLAVSEDGIGNIFGVLEGTEPGLAPVWTGSHIDTVPNAGMFDGMAGVAAGMEALQRIRESRMEHKRNIAVLVYTSEEPTRFGLSCLGSRALAGLLTLEDTKSIYDKDGNSLYRVLGEIGYKYADFCAVQKKAGDVYAAVELHVEQNVHLDQTGIPIGVVRGICGPTIIGVMIEGNQSHAGGTSMAERRDAFAAASELTLILEKLAKESKGEYVTGTIGQVDVMPNAVNVISGCVHLMIDIRSIDTESKETVVRELKAEAARIEKERGVKISMKHCNDDIPLKCDTRINELIKNVCSGLDVPYMEIISGPYHDSLFVGKFVPTSMLFVPSKKGVSHSKDEWTDFKDIALGAKVLAHTLLQLANE